MRWLRVHQIRTTFRLIAANETRPFRIHELLYKDEPSTMQSISPALSELAHGSSDIRPSSDGFFDLFTEKDYTVRAGPIKHTSQLPVHVFCCSCKSDLWKYSPLLGLHDSRGCN